MLIEGALVEAATKGRAGGWSDPALLVPLLGASLHQAWVTLSYQRGPNRALWSWGGLHRLSFRSFVGFDAHGDDVLWRFGGERPYPGQGGGVGMADYDPARPFDVRSASLYRVAMDLAKEDRMLTSLAPGQSEHSNLRACSREAPFLLRKARFPSSNSNRAVERNAGRLRRSPGILRGGRTP